MKLNSVALIFIYLAVILVVGALLPNQTVWEAKYGSQHKDPLGTYILFERLGDIFAGGEIEVSTTPVFNTLRGENEAKNYIFINDFYNSDQLDVDYLVNFVSEGGHAFVAAERFSYEFMDTIGFESYHRFYWARPFDLDSTRTQIFFTNPNLANDTAYVHKILRGSSVTVFDSVKVNEIEVLGKDIDGNVNFIRKKIGQGFIYVHLCPAAFSNYEMLYENTSRYVSNCLSYLPNGGVIFDDYYKSGKGEKASMLSVLLDKPQMQWAWNLALLSVVLFLIFGARRKSRAIPVLSPYENESLKYIESIGAMHYNHRNNRHIAAKRLQQLKHYLNRRFRIQESDWETMNTELFFERTGLLAEHWQRLFNEIPAISGGQEWEVSQLRFFSKEIDNIYSEIKAV